MPGMAGFACWLGIFDFKFIFVSMDCVAYSRSPAASKEAGCKVAVKCRGKAGCTHLLPHWQENKLHLLFSVPFF